ncbi:MAG: TAXI family TRAP transporter solute-binding subunit [Thermostichus sp. BF3_bins_97]
MEMQRRRFVLAVVFLGLAGIGGVVWGVAHYYSRSYVLQLATGSSTGEYYAFGQALATVVSRHHPHIRIDVLETEGSVQNIELVRDNKAQLALIQSDTPVRMPVQAVSFLFPEFFHLLARPEANIESVADLAGKRIALMPIGSGSYSLFWPLVAHYNLGPEDFQAQPMGVEPAYAALRQGEVDALFRITALGNPAIRDLVGSGQAELVPIDQAEALQLTLPYLEEMEIPKGTYRGFPAMPAEDMVVVGVRALLVAHDQVDTALIYTLTQLLYEYRNEIVELYPRAATIVMPESAQNLGVPLHAGARAYFLQDEPSFLERYAESLGFILSVFVLLLSSLWQFRLWLQERQKNRADMYNLQLLDLVAQIEDSADLETMAQLRRQLFEILRQVVSDLDQDRINPESFQSFTLPWEVAFTTLRHRERILMDAQSPEPNSAARTRV